MNFTMGRKNKTRWAGAIFVLFAGTLAVPASADIPMPNDNNGGAKRPSSECDGLLRQIGELSRKQSAATRNLEQATGRYMGCLASRTNKASGGGPTGIKYPCTISAADEDRCTKHKKLFGYKKGGAVAESMYLEIAEKETLHKAVLDRSAELKSATAQLNLFRAKYDGSCVHRRGQKLNQARSAKR